jgi:ribonuclease PH
VPKPTPDRIFHSDSRGSASASFHLIKIRSIFRSPSASGAFIELQGTAEGHAFRRHELDALLNLAVSGIGELCALQSQALMD